MFDHAFSLDKFIDREFEQELFENLLTLRDEARLLAIRAGGGMGKSRLLEKFQYRCRTVRPRIPVSLVALDQLSDASPLALIRQIVKQLAALGADFSMFTKNENARIAGDFLSIRAFLDFEMASFRDAKDVHIRGINVERAERVAISAEITQLTAEQDAVAQEASMTAFFTDLARICAEQPAVVMFDAYDRCPPPIQRWITEHFLEQMCFHGGQRPNQLIVVVAGRELPAFEYHWSIQECQSIIRPIDQMSTWERRHVEECLRVHGYGYTEDDVDLFYQLVQKGAPPFNVVGLIQSMLLAQRGHP